MVEEELHNLLDTYVEQVINGRDKVLFTEAVQAAKASALRAAYITLWLCCVESLKRKLQELAIRDFSAAKVISEVEELETAKRPVDDYLLEQAKKHGLVLANDSLSWSSFLCFSASTAVHMRNNQSSESLLTMLRW